MCIAYKSGRELATERFKLEFGEPDKSGCRPIGTPTREMLDETESKMLSLDGLDAARFHVSLTAINVCPSTAQLILHYEFLEKQSDLPLIGFVPKSHSVRELRRRAYHCRMRLLNAMQSKEMQARSHVFSRSDDLLVLIRMSLGHKFKDYRTCAFCGNEEKRKKRNKNGKRASSFKVCRMCKELNLHKSYLNASLGCHYCSLKCQHKQWNEHKVVHSGNGKPKK